MKTLFAPARWLIAVTVLSMSLAQAKIGDKNVILIHGFKPSHIVFPPSDGGQSESGSYWNGVNSAFFRQGKGTSNIIYWPSSERLTGAGGIISIVAPQIAALVNEGYCSNGCVIVTHSTGDLIARYLLKYKISIFGRNVANKFKVSAVIDMAGAGGGTELANYAVGIANGVNYTSDILSGILEYIGFSVSFGLNVGVLNDLQPSVARNQATNAFPAIPHLRVAGGGDHFFGLTRPLISGTDDSVVPLHSSCGAAFSRSYDSCSHDVRIDGRVTWVSDAPSASSFYDYHYPLIMSEGLAHNDMQTGQSGHAMTSTRSDENAYKWSDAYNLGIDIDDFEKREWWDWWRTYRWIRGADDKSITTVLVDNIVR